MVTECISYCGLNDLIIVVGTINEFVYARPHLFYKDNLEEFKKID